MSTVPDQEGSAADGRASKRGWITLLGAIGLLVAVGIVAAWLALSPRPAPAPVASTTSAARPGGGAASATKGADGSASICGLKAVTLTGSVGAAPKATWKYDGTTAYATSPDHGPGKDEGGVRSCFSHTPEGVLFASDNGSAQGGNARTVDAWLRYVLAPGAKRDQFLASAEAQPAQSYDDVRVTTVGFRMLEYSGNTAKVDLAVRTDTGGQQVTLSAIYSWEWQAGDWRLVIDDPQKPISMTQISDLSGYVMWGPQ